jgi:hypothetical protein
MIIGISDLAHSIRKNSAADAKPVPLSHAQQLVAAAMGYKTLASYQAAQAAGREPRNLDTVLHFIPDYDMLNKRAGDLGITITLSRLHELLRSAFLERMRQTVIHSGYESLEDALREQVEQVVIEDGEVNSAMADANYNGIDEVYFEVEIEPDQATIGNPLVIELKGHVSLGIDTERPYAGHKVNVVCSLTLERIGCHCFAAAECEVTKAALDYGWSSSNSEELEEGPPVRTRSQAYADVLGLELHEVGDLADVEPEPLTGHSGEMTYAYILDFSDYASQKVAAKILQRHGSLRIEVGLDVFENVRDDDWPY